MANIILKQEISIQKKIALMQDDAKFDIAEPERECQPKKALPKVPKIFLSNDCAFNCAYCGCRNTRDEKITYCNNPKDLARIAVSEARANGHGVFISSAIYKNADYTEELIIEALKSIRNEYNYTGYVHAKVMPGTDPLLIQKCGLYADRLSINIEVAKSEGYQLIAKQKNKKNILTPMRQISDMIAAAKSEKSNWGRKFATSQTTQLMAGSTNEDDRTILNLSEALYKKYNLSRVYYTSFEYKNPAKGYQIPFATTPRWRMRRLYQADRLMALYGFSPDEITPTSHSYLDSDLDPKTAWALRNLHLFPLELNKADREMLIRIPGIGLTYAEKILKARSYCKITFEILQKIGVPIKKCRYFVTCNGKFINGIDSSTHVIRNSLAVSAAIETMKYEQMSLDSNVPNSHSE